MSKKYIIIIAVIAVIAIGIFLFKDKLFGAEKKVSTALAFDDGDKPTFDAMCEAVKASSFKEDLPYILDIYATEYAPGKVNAPSDAYGTIAGKSTMASGFTKAIWTGWIGTYCKDIPTKAPADGKTQEQANEAVALIEKIAKMWEGYKASAAQKALTA